MRVLVFSTDDFLPPAGGAETAFGEVARRLSDWQFELVCARLNRRRPARQTVGNVVIHRIGFGIPKIDGLLLRVLGFRVAQNIHAAKPMNLVWSIMASYGALPALRFKKTFGVPFLLTLQEGGDLKSVEAKGRLLGPLFRQVFSRADGVHAISNYLAQWAKAMGYRGQHLRVIPNGVDVETFAQPLVTQERNQRRREWGWQSTDTILVTTSRLVPKNGVSDIIAALQKLPERFKLLICGDGYLKSALEFQVERSDLKDRVRFLGFLGREDLPVVLQASDVFVRPSLTEGLGSSFLEAMAAGLPVVATPVGGIPDFLVDQYNGFFCRPGDPEHLTSVIASVADLDRETKEKITVAGIKTVRPRYDWDTIASEMRQFMNNLCLNQ